MRLASGNLAPVMEAIQAMHHAQTMIHSLRRGPRLLLELVTDIVEQSGLGDLREGERQRPLAPPAGEVQQVISIRTQGAQRELANTLRIEEGVGPSDLLSLLIE